MPLDMLTTSEYHLLTPTIERMNEDIELSVMQKINTLLTELNDPEAIARVLRWAESKFQVATDLRNPGSSATANPIAALTGHRTYDSIPDLFDAASPETEAEKALVVAYWFQELQQQEDVDAQSINTELKNLGHGVGNVTRALARLIERRPRLLIQTRKAGSTQQARKRYRVTLEGLRHVAGMIQSNEHA